MTILSIISLILTAISTVMWLRARMWKRSASYEKRSADAAIERWKKAYSECDEQRHKAWKMLDAKNGQLIEATESNKRLCELHAQQTSVIEKLNSEVKRQGDK